MIGDSPTREEKAVHYTVSMDIDAPRDRVTQLFVDPTHFSDWINGLERYEVVSGEAGQTGAKAELRTVEGSKTYDMTETIEENQLPDGITMFYEVDGVLNRVVNRFSEPTAGVTRWVSENEFKFQGARRALNLIPFVFKGQTVRDMARFKEFVEGRSDQ